MDKIEKVTADIMVAERLKQWIIEQRLEAGDKLPTEAVLCQDLGVARHTLREGIKRLSQLGILESKTGSGTYIQAASYDKVEEYLIFLKDCREISKKEIYDVRIALESSAAEAAARNAADSEIRQLERLCRQMERCVDREDYDAFVEHNIEFHNAIASISKNRLLIGISQAIQNLTRYSMSDSYIAFQANAVSSLEGHRKIFDAIQLHDAEAARRCMIDHLVSTSAHKDTELD